MKNIQLEHGSTISELELINESGNQVSYSGPGKLNKNQYKGTDWFQKVINKNFVVSNLVEPEDSIPHFKIAVKKYGNGKYWILSASMQHDEQ